MTTSPGHGYCWVQHPDGGGRCTLSPGHGGNHLNWYASPDRREWPAEQPQPERAPE